MLWRFQRIVSPSWRVYLENNSIRIDFCRVCVGKWKYFHIIPKTLISIASIWKIESDTITTISSINCLALWSSSCLTMIIGTMRMMSRSLSLQFLRLLHKCQTLCTHIFTHFVKWLDNPLFMAYKKYIWKKKPKKGKTFRHFARERFDSVRLCCNWTYFGRQSGNSLYHRKMSIEI